MPHKPGGRIALATDRVISETSLSCARTGLRSGTGPLTRAERVTGYDAPAHAGASGVDATSGRKFKGRKSYNNLGG
jgi:hypothetical protein